MIYDQKGNYFNFSDEKMQELTAAFNPQLLHLQIPKQPFAELEHHVKR